VGSIYWIIIILFLYMLTIDMLKSLKSYQSFIPNQSQLEYYKMNNCDNDLLPLVSLSNKAFGELAMEHFTKEYFNLDDKSNTKHDHMKYNKKIEQKSCRYSCRGQLNFQHIQLDHDWDYLLLCFLDFHSIQYFIASKEHVIHLESIGVLKVQGTQGYVYKPRHHIDEDFTPVFDELDLIQFINSK